MYIFEWITKYIKGKKYQKYTNQYKLNNEQENDTNPQDCNHFFMPLDSTNNYYACKYCGIVINRKKLK